MTHSGTGPLAASQGSPYAQFKKRWPILLGCHISLCGAVSPAFVAVFGLFLTPMAKDLNWTRADVALAMSAYVMAGVVFTPIAGYLLDKIGARLASLIGAVGVPLGIVLFALAPPSTWAYLAAAAFLGTVGTFTFAMVYLSILPRWFDRRLGLAIALCVSGLASGGIITSMLARVVIEDYGWRTGWFCIAALALVLALGGRMLVPFKDLGDHAQGEGQGAVQTQADADIERARFLDDPTFWFTTAAFCLGLLTAVGIQVHAPSALTDRGLSPGFAATTVAMMAVGSMSARLLGGVLLDMAPFRWVASSTFVLQAIGCLLLAFSPSPIGAMAGAVFVAFSGGVETDMLPYFVRRRYGVTRFGRINGIMFGIVQIGAVVGPPLLGAGYDTYGDYNRTFLLLTICPILSSTLLLWAFRPSAPMPALRPAN